MHLPDCMHRVAGRVDGCVCVVPGWWGGGGRLDVGSYFLRASATGRMVSWSVVALGAWRAPPACVCVVHTVGVVGAHRVPLSAYLHVYLGTHATQGTNMSLQQT